MKQPSWAIKYQKEHPKPAVMPNMRPAGMMTFTGNGENGRMNPSMPTNMLQTNQGPRLVHEGELKVVEPNGGLNVIPQKTLAQMDRGGMPGFQTGTTSGGPFGTGSIGSGGFTGTKTPGIILDDAVSQIRNRGGEITGGGTIGTNGSGFLMGTGNPMGSSGIPTPQQQAILDDAARRRKVQQFTAANPTGAGPMGTGAIDPSKVILGNKSAGPFGTGNVLPGGTVGTPTPPTPPVDLSKPAALGTDGSGSASGSGLSPQELALRNRTLGDTIGSVTKTEPSIVPETSYDKDVKDAMALTKQYTNPDFWNQRIANALGQLGPTLQANMTTTAMQIANDPNMTEGAKRTAMASAMRDAGIAESELTSTMANEAMNLALEATGKYGTMAESGRTYERGAYEWEKKFKEELRQAGKSEAWTDFEYTAQYGSDADVMAAYKNATGRDLDPSAVAEIRGYARALRENTLEVNELTLEDMRGKLGDSTFNSISTMIANNATYEAIKARFPDFTEDDYKSMTQFRDRDFNYKTTMDNIGAALDAGDYTNASKLWETLGVTVDYSKLITAESKSIFNDAMSGLTTGILETGLGYDNATTQNFLQTAWKAQNPNVDFDSAQGRAWAKNTYDSIKLSGDPIYRTVYAMGDSTITDILSTTLGVDDNGAAIPGWQVGSFSYAGKTGVEAGRLAVTNLLITGGMSFDASGTLVPDLDNPAWSVFGVKPKAEGAPGEDGTPTYVGPLQFENDDAVINSPPNNTVVTPSGTAYKAPDNTVYEVNFQFGDLATSADANNPAINDNGTSGNWTFLTEGQVFQNSTNLRNDQLGWPNGSLPQGTYKLESVPFDSDLMSPGTFYGKKFNVQVYRNLRTGQIFLASTNSTQGLKDDVLSAIKAGTLK